MIARTCRPLFAAIPVALVVLFFTSQSYAATARVGSSYCGSKSCEASVFFEAAPGEANRLTITEVGISVRLTDEGATIQAGKGCLAESPNRVLCETGYGQLFSAEVELGDGNDSVSIQGLLLNATGGPGDDLLEGWDGSDVLDGGAGRDVLKGGAGGDALMAGGDEVAGGLSDRDLVDGGEGRDRVSYEKRKGAVAIVLGSPGAGGGVGEGDEIRSIEDAIGGSGSDRIVGDDQENTIHGQAGADTLDGGAGVDSIHGGAGTDGLYGGADADSLDADGMFDHASPLKPSRFDRIDCGAGVDVVEELDPSDELDASCEGIEGSTVAPALRHRLLLALAPRSLRLPLARGFWECGGCSVSMSARVIGKRRCREAPPGAWLAHERVHIKESRKLSLKLSSLGRRGLERCQRLRVQVGIVTYRPNAYADGPKRNKYVAGFQVVLVRGR